LSIDIRAGHPRIGAMSITEVARLAGVAHGTVSRLINGRGGVAEETARRIRKAMRELGWEPPPPDRRRGRKPSPAGIRTGSIGLLLVGISRGFIERPGVDKTVASIERLLRGHGLSMVLTYAADFGDLPPVITRRKVDGLLIVGETHDSLPKEYRSLPAVWVLSSHALPHRWADHVLPDNHEVGSLAADYLADHGHRRVAFVNDQPKHPGFQERGGSFAAAAEARGLEVSMLVAEAGPENEGEGPWGEGCASRQAALADRWRKIPRRPTGLFVPSDEQTFRLYPLLQYRGLRPGRDWSIISCDNQDYWLRYLAPRPPSIDLNFALIGQHAVDQLLRRISHPERAAGTRILVAPRLAE